MEITNSPVKQVALESVSTQSKASDVVPSNSDIAAVKLPDTTVSNQQDQEQNLQGAVSQINNYVQNLQRSLLFTVDEASGKDVVTVLDTETEEVIRQYPSEEVLVIARQLAEQSDEVLSLFSSRI